jgi:hypothetical protein
LGSKKPAHQVPKSGWIILCFEKNIPCCYWVTTKEQKQLPIVLDERLFGDTIFKAEQTGKDTYNIIDIWLYNSSCIYAGTSFPQRTNWIQDILSVFHTNVDGLTKLTHLKQNTVTVKKSLIPDVYFIKNHEGYVQIPDIKTSRFMRSKGDEFELNCKQHGEFWVIQENIPDVKVNATKEASNE